MSDQSPVVRVTVDDETYDIDFSDLTALDAKDFRKEVGVALMSVLTNEEDADIDVVAGLVWLARRKKEYGKGGAPLAYRDVAKTITFLSSIDMGDAGEVEPDPET